MVLEDGAPAAMPTRTFHLGVGFTSFCFNTYEKLNKEAHTLHIVLKVLSL
jgi:hypothetical protein